MLIGGVPRTIIGSFETMQALKIVVVLKIFNPEYLKQIPLKLIEILEFVVLYFYPFIIYRNLSLRTRR